MHFVQSNLQKYLTSIMTPEKAIEQEHERMIFVWVVVGLFARGDSVDSEIQQKPELTGRWQKFVFKEAMIAIKYTVM